MRAVQKRAFRQFRVLKWQQDENAFLGRCMLNLFGGVLNIHGWRNQQKETRSVLLSQFIQYTEAGKRLGHDDITRRQGLLLWPEIRNQVIDFGRGLPQKPIVDLGAMSHPTAEAVKKVVARHGVVQVAFFPDLEEVTPEHQGMGEGSAVGRIGNQVAR